VRMRILTLSHPHISIIYLLIIEDIYMTNKYIGLFWAVIVISFAGSITRLLHNEYDLFTR
jgi:hypothetical protein